MPDAPREFLRPREFMAVTIPPAKAAPPGQFGRLAELGGFLAEREVSSPLRAQLVVVTGDHAVAAAGVSAQQPDATADAIARIRRGAGVAALAEVAGAGVLVAAGSDGAGLDGAATDGAASDGPSHGVRVGSGRIDREDALTDTELDAALTVGRALGDAQIDAGADLLLVGHLGVGATTAAAVVVAALTGAEPVAVIGRGSGIDDATWMRKAAAVRDALRRAKTAEQDPAALLRIAGGADIAALAAFLAQAAARRVPVLLDGVVTVAAALVADRLAPAARAWWLAAHADPEPAHRLALEHLGLVALLDLGLSVGDGSGALAALPLVRMAGALRDTVPSQ